MSSIKLVSWNIEYSADVNEIKEALEQINAEYKPDVLLLQELTSDTLLSNRPDMPQFVGKLLKMNYVTSTHDHKKFRFTESVGIYSPHKIKQSDGYTINQRRGVQSAAITFEGKSVAFIAIHLTSPVVNPKAYYEECEELIEFAAKFDKRTVFGGDLNSNLDADVIKDLKKSFNFPGEKPETWHTRLPVSMQLDHIFTTRDIKIVKFESLEIGPSDHRPVYAELQFNN